MKKILIVEDDISIATLQKDYLEVSGYFVYMIHDGLCAINHITKEKYDLIILDIMLPSMNGLEILNYIREKSDIPVLLVSAKKEEIDKIKGLGLGADDYITKPFSPGELVARVKAHISKYERLINKYTKNYQSDFIQTKGLYLDINARRVFINQKEINLTSKEFDLLLYLAQHPNIVFRKEDLFDTIWGIDSLGELATVTVHVSRIREKIESDPSNPQYIETVWGTGYRFKN